MSREEFDRSYNQFHSIFHTMFGNRRIDSCQRCVSTKVKVSGSWPYGQCRPCTFREKQDVTNHVPKTYFRATHSRYRQQDLIQSCETGFADPFVDGIDPVVEFKVETDGRSLYRTRTRFGPTEWQGTSVEIDGDMVEIAQRTETTGESVSTMTFVKLAY